MTLHTTSCSGDRIWSHVQSDSRFEFIAWPMARRARHGSMAISMEPAIAQLHATLYWRRARNAIGLALFAVIPVTFLHSDGTTCTHAHAVDHSKQKRSPKINAQHSKIHQRLNSKIFTKNQFFYAISVIL